MKLRTKFILLIVGTFAIPTLTIFLIAQVIIANRRDVNGRLVAVNASGVKSTLERLSKRGAEAADIPKILEGTSPGSQLIVFDDGKNVLYSSLDIGSLSDLVSINTETLNYTFSQARIKGTDGREYTVVFGLKSRSLVSVKQRTFIIVTIFGPVLLFMALMSAFIIRSINVSIVTLEEATRRIAEGDLDFKLHPRGNDSIASLTRSFDIMREQVQEAAATRSRFIMAISHDLKTPLAGILGYLDAIQDGVTSDPDQLKGYFSIIRQKTALLESRIRQLIDYVKIDTSEWKQRTELLPLAAFLNEAATIFAAEAEVRGFTFSSSIELEEEVLAPFDGDLVFRALENLVQNSFNYADDASTIRFTAEESGGAILVSVVNIGPPIADKDLPFIFEPFYRGSKSRQGKGFGLGLSVVKSVIDGHGWDLKVESKDRETSFTIVIPEPDVRSAADPGALGGASC